MSSMRRYQQPSDTSYNWSKYNPVLLLGEIGYETDTGKFKIGNGHSTWEDIEYFSSGNGTTVAGITVDVEKQSIVSDLLGATTNQYSNKSISLGVSANGSMQSIAIGELANGSMQSIAIGINTIAQYASVSLGFSAKSAYGGVSIGNACNTSSGAVAVGFHTMSKNNSIALGTGIITGDNQVVLGKYNIEDTENKYAYILGDGNGTVNPDGTFSNRVGKNLHTIDHNGNAHFLGKVSIDSNVSILDDGDEYVLVTKKFVQEYVNNAIQNAIGNIMNGDNVAY